VAALPSVPALVTALNDRRHDVRRVAGHALARIAAAARDARRLDAVRPLSAASSALAEQHLESSAPFSEAMRSLEALRQHSMAARLADVIHDHPTATLVICAYTGLALLWLGLLWLRPRSILALNDALRRLPKLRLPGWLGALDLAPSHLVLVGFLHHHPRVLDAWVARHLEEARAGFERLAVVRQAARGAGSIVLDGARQSGLGAGDLRRAFARRRTCVLVVGGAGSGKTALACEMARWGMAADRPRRLCEHPMIPVVINEDLVYKPDKGADPFVLTVREKLPVEQAPSEELVAHLLRAKRLFVIVDGFSELGEHTRAAIRPSDPDFPAAALLLTSRREEIIGGLHTTVINTTGQNEPVEQRPA